MIHKPRQFTPGPTAVLPAIQFAMATSTIQPGTSEFRALYTRVHIQLQQFLGTTHDVVLLSSSGTGAMEAAVSNLTSPGDRVLVLIAGRYGERWSALAKNFGCAVDEVIACHGQTFSPDAIKAALKLETRAVFVQATETSTGVQHDIAAIARLLKDEASEALLVVDAISSLGSSPLDIDILGVDILLAGSQTLMVPPGLSFLAVSESAWDRMEATYNARYYFDLRKERKSARRGESAYTPATSLIVGLSAALDVIAAQAIGDLAAGRRLLITNAETSAAMTRAALLAMGFQLFAPEASSAAVTAVIPPDGVDAAHLIDQLQLRFGTRIAGGHGELEGRILRIAHLGFTDYMDTIALIAAIEQVLASTILHLALGTGPVAAQKVYAEYSGNLSSEPATR
ncbi:pyridoxal-phosphate-dependent aminotransferase family protein [Granulicella sibirica]|uniref:Serine--glyoxylate aminotransferase n=1 Tax=Granulicella sibirica TaxID=2479048 RepID=A0A4Q0T2B4_9BACT|nr:alanine--glyoxylate aminotransferase family protein [Granulicella sibirica]RXH57743.1 Serine--glyoxylate aminotransferase [Granulicella sibirica]